MTEHVVVIGAGIYGASVAAELSRRGARVTVVDGTEPARGTSNATFAWTNANGSKQPRAYHDLNVAGMQAHRVLASNVAGSDWYHESGNIEWADDDEHQQELQRQVDRVTEWGYEARWITRSEALRLEPDINVGELPPDGIAYFPREGWVAPTRLIAHLLATSNPTRIWNDRVVGLTVTDGSVRSVNLSSGRQLEADAVVNCAGPQAAEVAQLANLKLPMDNQHGVLIHTSPAVVALSRVVRSPRAHLRPDGGGRIQLATHELDEAVSVTSTGRTAVDHDAVNRVIEASRALYPGLRSTDVESIRVGERPIPQDGLPVLGAPASLQNFYFAVSHSGVTLGLYAGGLVAAEVLGEDHSGELGPFRPDRF